MDFGDLARIVTRHWLVGAVVFLAVTTGVGLGTLTQETKYQSTAAVAVYPGSQSYPSLALYGNYSQGLLATYTNVVESPTFLGSVARGLPFATNASELHSEVSASPVPNASVLRVSALNRDPRRAQQVATAVVHRLVGFVDAQHLVRMQVTTAAQVPTSPATTSRNLLLVSGVLVGVVLALCAALAWDRVFPRVSTPHELQRASGVPVLGVLPNQRRRNMRQAWVIVGSSKNVPLEEALRTLRGNLYLPTRDISLRSLAVMSPNAGDGKSTVAGNLAVLSAEAGAETLLIDGDFYRPSQRARFAIAGDSGVTSLSDDRDLAAAARPTIYEHLSVVPSGDRPESRGGEVSAIQRLAKAVKVTSEICIIDTVPLAASADVRQLASSVDCVLLVIKANAMTPKECADAVASLEMVGASIVGAVLNRAHRKVARQWRYGAGDSYYPYGQASVPVLHIPDSRSHTRGSAK